MLALCAIYRGATPTGRAAHKLNSPSSSSTLRLIRLRLPAKGGSARQPEAVCGESRDAACDRETSNSGVTPLVQATSLRSAMAEMLGEGRTWLEQGAMAIAAEIRP